MAQATTTRGGKIRVLLASAAAPNQYTAPCGFTQRSVSLDKGLEESSIPDCDDPDAVDWVGRDASTLSMSISGEGVLAQESVETWLDAWENVDSIPVKVEWEFPAKTITWTGHMHVEKMEVAGDNGKRATANISMQSDGKMTRVVTPK